MHGEAAMTLEYVNALPCAIRLKHPLVSIGRNHIRPDSGTKVPGESACLFLGGICLYPGHSLCARLLETRPPGDWGTDYCLVGHLLLPVGRVCFCCQVWRITERGNC
ncbi:hypothetical protein J3F84DRAFT_271951 [Trichoderma pleuroticola]